MSNCNRIKIVYRADPFRMESVLPEREDLRLQFIELHGRPAAL